MELYGAAFRSGAVMLQVGLGESAAAEAQIRGALAALAMSAQGKSPQFFGLDADAGMVRRARAALVEGGIADRAVLLCGGLPRFRRMVPIGPTMVFLAGRREYADAWGALHELAEMVGAGTPMLCEACDDAAVEAWTASGHFVERGGYGGARVLEATERCGGGALALPWSVFERVRDDLAVVYESPSLDERRVMEAAAPARAACMNVRRTAMGQSRSAWPFAAEENRGAPDCLPDGRPWPKISIVTPSYNYGAFIEETILSVLRQGYPNVEHIVMDGGSTDGTLAVLERYRDQLAHVASEKDRGQSHAINKGFALATGELFTWLNADDLLAPGALHAMALAFYYSEQQRRDGGADMVAGICEEYRDGVLLERHLTSCADGPLPLKELLDVDWRWARGQFFMQPEVMFRRSIWERAGGYVEESLYYSMDYELWLRYALHGARLHVIGRPICRFRHHAAQKTASAEKFMPELRKVRDAFAARHGLKLPRTEACDEKTERQALRLTSVNDLGFQHGAGIGQRRLLTALAAGGHQVMAFAATDRVGSAARASVEEIVEAIGQTSPNVVMVGNVHGAAMEPELAGALAKRWPTAVVLHDLWWLTGRCAYAGSCTQYLTGCDAGCPTAAEYPTLEPERIEKAWRTKHETYAKEAARPMLWANSAWTAEKARGSLAARGNDAMVAQVCCGVELDVFRPMDKAFCRRELGLPAERFVVLCSASDLSDLRKGVRVLAEALRRLSIPELLVVCLGEMTDAMLREIPGARALGYLRDPRQLAMAYAAADLFVGPSLEEAFGQVFTEAAACGTPSVGFPVDGIPESLPDGISGWLTLAPTADELAVALFELYRDPRRRAAMEFWGRVHAENEWSVERAYHRLQAALRQAGIFEKCNVPPKIRFKGFVPVLAEAVNLGLHRGEWEGVSGMLPWEGPYPEKKLPRCRWMVGSLSVLEIRVARAGRYRLRLVCTSLEKGTTLRVMCGGTVVKEASIAMRSALTPPTVVTCEVQLRETSTLVELHHWPWQATADGRGALSVLLFELTVADARGEALAEQVVLEKLYSAAERC